MSSRRYCDLNEPHPAHEWSSPSRIDIRAGLTDYFYCDGVLDDPALWVVMRRLDEARKWVEFYEKRLATVALRHRRKEPE